MLLEAWQITMLDDQLKERIANWTLSSFLCNLINVLLQRALCAKKHIAQLDDFANHYGSFTQLSIGNDWRYRSELVKVQHIFKTGWPVLFMHVVVSSSLVASQLSIKSSKPETLTMVLAANDCGRHSCRVHGQLEAWMLLGWRLVHFCGARVRHFLNQSAARNCLKLLKHFDTSWSNLSYL